MSDPTLDQKPSKPAKVNDGFTAPIDDPGEGKVPEHIHPDTLMAKGVDPDTKERVAISLAVLKKEHGEKKAKVMYRKIAVAGGFFDPNVEPMGSDFAPDLSLDGMNKEARAKVDAILNAKE